MKIITAYCKGCGAVVNYKWLYGNVYYCIFCGEVKRVCDNYNFTIANSAKH